MLWLQIQNGLRCQEGQDLSEYALILGLVVLITIAAVTLLGDTISAFWAQVVAQLTAAI